MVRYFKSSTYLVGKNQFRTVKLVNIKEAGTRNQRKGEKAEQGQ